MKIAESVASILLSEDGRTIFLTAGIEVGSLSWLEVDVEESEDLGLWIRIERGPKRELLLGALGIHPGGKFAGTSSSDRLRLAGVGLKSRWVSVRPFHSALAFSDKSGEIRLTSASCPG